MSALLDMLATGERKQVALSGEAADRVIEVPALLPDLISALSHDDPAVVSHAAHALLTVFKKAPALLEPQAVALLAAFRMDQWEIKEQLAKILPFLTLSDKDRDQLLASLEATLRTHKSGIARTCALQAITDLARQDQRYIKSALGALDYASCQPSKALQARARKLSTSL